MLLAYFTKTFGLPGPRVQIIKLSSIYSGGIERKRFSKHGVQLPKKKVSKRGNHFRVPWIWSTDLKQKTGSSFYCLESEAKESWRQPSCWDHLETLSYMLALRRKSFGCYPRTTCYSAK